MRIAVIGAGAWGTAVAIAAARHPAGHAVTLWARDGDQARAMQAQRENARYLPGLALPPSLKVRGGGARQALDASPGADLLVIATPVAGLRAALEALRDAVAPVAWLCKGFERVPEGAATDAYGLLPHEVQRQVAPRLRGGVLSGPSFAQEVARGLPAALVAASASPAVVQALVAALHGPALRVYGNDDLVGVEVGGAVKNVLAIAAGLADGLQLGLNARAALITRGLAEMMRLGAALGGQRETFEGLAGVGDLVLTCTDDQSRNRRMGLALGRGQSREAAHKAIDQVVEGVDTAHEIHQLGRRHGVELPISEQVYRVLYEGVAPKDAVHALLARDPKPEAG